MTIKSQTPAAPARYRCKSCGQPMIRLWGRELTCEACWEKHLDHAADADREREHETA